MFEAPRSVEDIIDPEVQNELTSEQISALEKLFAGGITPGEALMVARISEEVATGTNFKEAVKKAMEDRKNALEKISVDKHDLLINSDGTIRGSEQ
jgi:hypothetical protein